MESKNYFAKIISYLFHPLFMPSYGILYLFFSGTISGFNLYSPDSEQIVNYKIIGLVVLLTFLIPFVAVVYLKKRQMIQSFQMENKEERILPFTITGFCVFVVYFLLFNYFNFSVNPIVQIFLSGCLISIVMGLGLTLKWKVSVHMIGIGGFTGAIFLLSSILQNVLFLELIIALMIAGLIAYSRLRLKAHDISQIVVGFVVGFFSETFLLLFN